METRTATLYEAPGFIIIWTVNEMCILFITHIENLLSGSVCIKTQPDWKLGEVQILFKIEPCSK